MNQMIQMYGAMVMNGQIPHPAAQLPPRGRARGRAAPFAHHRFAGAADANNGGLADQDFIDAHNEMLQIANEYNLLEMNSVKDLCTSMTL